jgi:C-terminal processing protease CtpA/Prc
MAQGIGFTIGVTSQFPAQSVAGSDHVAFLEAGIPALHLFSGLHTDYHRPSDTPDKLDLAGMSDIALWVEEAIVYLAMRDQPLRVTLSNAPVRATEAVAGARAASLGTIPEFNYAGEGVQISGVTPGGAAEAAGLQAGDILVQFNGTPITTLQEYSNFLREAAPGDEVQLQIRRAEELLNVEVILQAR